MLGLGLDNRGRTTKNAYRRIYSLCVDLEFSKQRQKIETVKFGATVDFGIVNSGAIVDFGTVKSDATQDVSFLIHLTIYSNLGEVVAVGPEARERQPGVFIAAQVPIRTPLEPGPAP
jgi:hypothetical protein